MRKSWQKVVKAITFEKFENSALLLTVHNGRGLNNFSYKWPLKV